LHCWCQAIGPTNVSIGFSCGYARPPSVFAHLDDARSVRSNCVKASPARVGWCRDGPTLRLRCGRFCAMRSLPLACWMPPGLRRD